FQAEDGIRDGHVTGVQTCALPISAGARLSRRLLLHEVRDVDLALDPRLHRRHRRRGWLGGGARALRSAGARALVRADRVDRGLRSEERRVGNESGWWMYGSTWTKR